MCIWEIIKIARIDPVKIQDDRIQRKAELLFQLALNQSH